MNSENLNNKYWRQEININVKDTSIVKVIDFEQIILNKIRNIQQKASKNTYWVFWKVISCVNGNEEIDSKSPTFLLLHPPCQKNYQLNHFSVYFKGDH
jgi:hypothetical protein